MSDSASVSGCSAVPPRPGGTSAEDAGTRGAVHRSAGRPAEACPRGGRARPVPSGALRTEARWAAFALFLLAFFLGSAPVSFRRPFLTSFLTSRRHVDLLRVCSASCPAR